MSDIAQGANVMTTKVAAAYCGFKNARGLISAYRRGKVRPYGRRGGTGAFVWRREDLDAFLRGESPLGHSMALRDSAQGDSSGGLAPQGRGVLRAMPRDGPPHGQGAPIYEGAPGRGDRPPRRAKGPGPASTRGPGSVRGAAVAAALERIRRIAVRGEGD